MRRHGSIACKKFSIETKSSWQIDSSVIEVCPFTLWKATVSTEFLRVREWERERESENGIRKAMKTFSTFDYTALDAHHRSNSAIFVFHFTVSMLKFLQILIRSCRVLLRSCLQFVKLEVMRLLIRMLYSNNTKGKHFSFVQSDGFSSNLIKTWIKIWLLGEINMLIIV